MDSALGVTADFLAQWAYSPAFPELAHLPLRALRRFQKATPVNKFRKAAAALVAAAERNAAWVAQKRDGADFSPKARGQGPSRGLDAAALAPAGPRRSGGGVSAAW